MISILSAFPATHGAQHSSSLTYRGKISRAATSGSTATGTATGGGGTGSDGSGDSSGSWISSNIHFLWGVSSTGTGWSVICGCRGAAATTAIVAAVVAAAVTATGPRAKIWRSGQGAHARPCTAIRPQSHRSTNQCL